MQPAARRVPVVFLLLERLLDVFDDARGRLQVAKDGGISNAQLMTDLLGLGVALKLSMISRMGFLVREADVEAVMDHTPRSAAAASSFDERGVIRAAGKSLFASKRENV